MHLCVYASEVAAAIGKNPYQHPVIILLRVWQRYHQGKEYRQACAEVSQDTGRDQNEYQDSDIIIEKAIEQSDELKQIVTAHQKTISTTTNVRQVIQTAKDEIKTVLYGLDTVPRTQNGESDVKLELSMALGQKKNAARDIKHIDIVDYVESKLKKHYGRVREKDSLYKLGNVTDNNATFKCKSIYQHGDLSVSVGGKNDGFRNGRLVEIKNRQSRFMVPLPEYDLVQVHCYMFLCDQREADLIEHLQTTEGWREKITIIRWNKSLWNTISDELIIFGKIFQQLLGSKDWQHNLLQANTATQQKQVFFQIYHQVTT